MIGRGPGGPSAAGSSWETSSPSSWAAAGRPASDDAPTSAVAAPANARRRFSPIVLDNRPNGGTNAIAPEDRRTALAASTPCCAVTLAQRPFDAGETLRDDRVNVAGATHRKCYAATAVIRACGPMRRSLASAA